MKINCLNLTSVNGTILNLNKRIKKKKKKNCVELGPTLGSWVSLFQYSGLKLCDLIKIKETSTVFPCEYCEIFKNTSGGCFWNVTILWNQGEGAQFGSTASFMTWHTGKVGPRTLRCDLRVGPKYGTLG